MITDDMNSLEITLTTNNAIVADGIDISIPAVVYEVLDRGAQSRLNVLLNHEEAPIAVAGLHQQRLPHETRRPDGGLRYFHGNSTSHCFMTAYPFSGAGSDPETKDYFVAVMSHLLREQGYAPQKITGDLDQDGKRLLSLSHNTHPTAENNKVRMSRACWYNTQGIDSLRDVIERSGLLFADYKRRVEPLAAMRRAVVRMYSPQPVSLRHFVSEQSIAKARELQHKEYENGLKGACLLGPYPNY